MMTFNRLKFLSVLFTLIFIVPLYVYAGQFKITRVYDGDTVKASRS